MSAVSGSATESTAPPLCVFCNVPKSAHSGAEHGFHPNNQTVPQVLCSGCGTSCAGYHLTSEMEWDGFCGGLSCNSRRPPTGADMIPAGPELFREPGHGSTSIAFGRGTAETVPDMDAVGPRICPECGAGEDRQCDFSCAADAMMAAAMASAISSTERAGDNGLGGGDGGVATGRTTSVSRRVPCKRKLSQ